ncbi:PIG-L family deacetylase [Brevibacterium litoralis]|uniref:PIG-L family deacetylase n=1 Tax=Brevibacterium litoralis TaxID=3138935 RepID=UPI0032EE52EF
MSASSRSPRPDGQTPHVLFVHAHPDDETITTGGTMAALVSAGARVTLLTCTRGEGGEVIGEALAHLEGDREALAAHREGELARAMEILGVTDHRFLGDGTAGGATGGLHARRFEDSGMEWGPDGHARAASDMPAAALCAVDAEVPAGYVRQVLEELHPDLVITYAEGGGYGHPDHVRVHEATTLAALQYRAAHGSFRPGLLYVDTPVEVARAAFDPGQPGFDLTGFDPVDKLPTVAATAPLAVAQDVDAQLGAKSLAMAAHATQITVSGHFFALSNGVGQRILDTEYFTDAGYPGPDAASYAPAGSVLAAIPPAVDAPGAGTGASEAPVVGSALAATDTGGGAIGREGASGAGRPVVTDAPGETGTAPRDGARQETARTRLGISGGIHVGLVVLLVGVLGSLQHMNASVWMRGDTGSVVPWGLGLAVAMTAAALWHLATMYRSARAVVIAGALVSGIAFLLGQPWLLPGADYLVTGTWRSMVWMFSPVVLGFVFTLVLPSLRPGARE